MILKIEDIRSWDKDTIKSKISEQRSELFRVRMQRFSTGVEKPHIINVVKANIAKCSTVLTEKREK